MLKVLRCGEFLAFHVLEGCSTDKNFEESDTQGPNIGFPCVVNVASSTFRREILMPNFSFHNRSNAIIKLTSGVPYARLLKNAFLEFMSYFSAKPKSTRTGIRFDDNMMFAGL